MSRLSFLVASAVAASLTVACSGEGPVSKMTTNACGRLSLGTGGTDATGDVNTVT